MKLSIISTAGSKQWVSLLTFCVLSVSQQILGTRGNNRTGLAFMKTRFVQILSKQLGPCPQIMSLRLKTTRAINSKLIWCHLRPSWGPWTVAWANELLALRSILSNFTVYCCVKCSNVSRVFSEEHPFIFVSNNNAEMMAEVGYLWRFSCSLILWSSQTSNYCS